MINSQMVSVVMPAYNAEKFIGESINSVIAQLYSNWELIIVDDGSTDNTKGIVFNFQKTEPRIKYIWQQNGKQGKARNTGIENATGELIAFLDADDVWLPEMLERQLGLLVKTKSDLVFSPNKFIDKQSKMLDEFNNIPCKIYHGNDGFLELIKGNIIPIITVLAQKNSIIRAGAFKTAGELQYGEDYDLWLRMLIGGAKFVCNDQPLAFYRKHEMQATRLLVTRYLQILAVIQKLSVDKNLQREKDAAIYMWLRRSFINSKNLEYRKFRELIGFMPSFYLKKISLLASYVLPMYVLRRMTYRLIFLDTAGRFSARE